MSVLKDFVPKDEYMQLLRQCDRLVEELKKLKDEHKQTRQFNVVNATKLYYSLQPQEAMLFCRLAEVYPRALTKLALHDWISSSASSEPEIVDVRVCFLRRKIAREAIETIWGRGYRLTEVGMERYKKALDWYEKRV